jgi:hypothetical protein
MFAHWTAGTGISRPGLSREGELGLPLKDVQPEAKE